MEVSFGMIATLLVLFGFLHKGESQVPTNVFLRQYEQEPYTSTDEICLGQKSILKSFLNLPKGNTKATIEIMASLGSTLLSIGDIISVQAGQGLSVGSPEWKTPAMHTSKEGCYKHLSGIVEYQTRAVYSLGTVTNTGTFSVAEDNQIIIEYEVVLVCDDGSVSNGEEFWSSVGAEYGDEKYIWIAMNSYKFCNTPKSVEASPAFTLVPGTAEIAIGEPLAFQLTANIPNPVTAIRVTGLVNEDKSYAYIHSIRLKSVSKAYKYSIVDQTAVKHTNKCPFNSALDLSYATIVNKESQEASPVASYNNLVFEIVVGVLGGETSVSYSIGFAVELGPSLQYVQKIYASTKNVTVVPRSLPDFQQATMTLPPGPITVQTNKMEIIALDMMIPKNSYQEYTVSLVMTPQSGEKHAVYIGAVVPASYGINLPCPIPNTVRPMIEASKATYSFTIRNFAFSDVSQDDDKLSLNLVVYMTSDVIQGETYQLTATVTHGNVSVGPETTVIKIGAPATLQKSAEFTFDLALSHTTSQFHSRSSVMFDFKITTALGVMSGPMTIEFPVPTELETANALSFCSAKITYIGVNVVCVQPGELKHIDIVCCTNTTIKNATKWARLVLPMVCNLDSGATEAGKDSFHIEAIVKIEDFADTLQSSPVSIKLSVGVKYTQTQISVSSQQITVKAQEDLSEPVIIRSVSVPKTEFEADWLNLYDIQFSTDRLQYYDITFSWTDTEDGSVKILTPSFPVLTRYPRLTGKLCKPIKTSPTTTFNTDPATNIVEIYGETPKDKTLKNYLMLALDKNRDTCFDLPNTDNTDFPSLLWLKVATTFLQLSGSEAYSVKVIGKGLDCHRHGRENVTQALYPTVSLTNNFYGKMRHCQSQLGSGSPDGEDRIICHYHCNCNDAMTCGHLLVFILAKENIGSNDFQLCELEVAKL